MLTIPLGIMITLRPIIPYTAPAQCLSSPSKLENAHEQVRRKNRSNHRQTSSSIERGGDQNSDGEERAKEQKASRKNQ
jgi:hypothetical protein